MRVKQEKSTKVSGEKNRLKICVFIKIINSKLFWVMNTLRISIQEYNPNYLI